jgi:hypothetical protein
MAFPSVKGLGACLMIMLLLTCGCNNSGKKSASDPGLKGSNDHNYEFDPEQEMMEARFNKVKNMLVFHINDTMSVDTTYYASLALGKNITLAAIEQEIAEVYQPGAKVSIIDTTITVGLQMSATLEDKSSKDDPYFDIAVLGEGVTNSNVRKYDPRNNSLIWRWKVTPKKPGRQMLILTIAEVDKKGEVRHPEYRQYRVMIFSEKKATSSGLGSFLNKNWQWLVGVIFMPLFVAWFSTRRRNRMAKTSSMNRY